MYDLPHVLEEPQHGAPKRPTGITLGNMSEVGPTHEF